MSLTLLEAAKAKLDGKRVEVYMGGLLWMDWDGKQWNDSWKVRIAPEPKKRVKYLAFTNEHALFWRTESSAIPDDWKRAPSEDKEIEMEE